MLSPEDRNKAIAVALLRIWDVVNAPKKKVPVAQVEILTRIAVAIYTLPTEILNSIDVEVKRRRSCE